MPRSTKRKPGKSPALAAPYAGAEQPADPYALGVRFFPGERVRIGGHQVYTVKDVTWNQKAGDYLVHGQAGVLHFYLWQKDVQRA